MMKIFVTISLLFSIFGSTICSALDRDMGSDFQKIEESISSTLVVDQNCYSQEDESHNERGSCGDMCDHHGHCHCGFLINSTKISVCSSDLTRIMSSDNLNSYPQINTLFRPPIA